jgi:hypothetical protein
VAERLAASQVGLSSKTLLSSKAVPELMRLVVGFPQWQPGFDPWTGHVGFVVNKVALG